MSDLAPSMAPSKRRAVVCDEEVAELAQRYGAPVRRTYQIQADDYLRVHRFNARSDRRAEVVFAIEDLFGRFWVHAKGHYPSHIYRLPSGGIHWDESVEDALFREVAEETAFAVEVKRFVGVIDYQLYYQEHRAHFASYVFHLGSGDAKPQPHDTEGISDFRTVLPSQLSGLATDLRNLIGNRRGWGQFRAIAHDLVHEHLAG